MFELDKESSFAEKEEKTLQFWEKEQIFERSVDEKKGKPLFSFYDGPPFATGLPHYGNFLAGTIKDVILRYKTMQGYYVPRRFGWDCHGLPVENEIEKEKELYGAKAIEEYGIKNFNQDCAGIVCRYCKEWKSRVLRMGRFVDFDATYRTMDLHFMESVLWVFKQLFDKGLVYEGFKVMPFSAKLGTPLSNFEANLNYQEVDDPSLTITFPVEGEENTYFLAWTTTPWTLLSNLALGVDPDMEYVKVKEEKTGKMFILAHSLLNKYFKEGFSILSVFPGKELAGKKYQPLFPYFKEEGKKGAFQVLLVDFVTQEEGTGIVHMAPAFGEVDFYACQKGGIELVCPVDNNGHFTQEVGEYADLFVKDADKQIIRALKEKGYVFSHSQIRHRYPFCWRSDTPLIYKAVSTWFVAVEKIKDRMIEVNKKIHWVPGHIKAGRFGKWLENARDWAISRNRFWGTPIPIWRSEDGEIIVIGSISELEKYTGSKIKDLHRDFIDDLVIEKEGKTFKRIPEVFDCWFESGSMPYAQNHYPFEKKEDTEKGFPADFIAEGLDQTRGWFYTLTVLSTALFDEPAFKNVIVNGIILAEDGNKMSKRLKNYPEPEKLIHETGADAIRLYMLHSPAVRGEDLRFSKRGVELVLRQVIIPLWNAYSFLSTYANIYKWTPSDDMLKEKPKATIDRWILSLSQKLVSEVTEHMETYELERAAGPLVEFVENLTNWYIRRSRTRFWAEEDTQDRREAFATLYTVLVTFSKVASPFIPFMADTIYRSLKSENMPDSVHLCDFPKADENFRDVELENEMKYVSKAVSIGHSLRKEHRLKVRQPLAKAHLVAADSEILRFLEKQKNLIQDELNVKDVEFHAEEIRFVSYLAKPNFPVLGKKVGKLMPLVKKEIESLSKENIDALLAGNNIQLSVENETFSLTPEDVSIERKVIEGIAAANDEDIALAIDTHLTEELKEEALAREIVNKLNTMRREQGFEVTDRIQVTIDSTKALETCFAKYKDYITHEVLATKVDFAPAKGEKWDLNGEIATIQIEKDAFF